MYGLKQGGFYDKSQIFHAYHYFKLKYQWPEESAVDADLQDYCDALTKDYAVLISGMQGRLFALLSAMNPNFEQEAYLPEAGRRVDFLYKNKKLVIQYNGSIGHYDYDNTGMPNRPAIQDVLANATMELAGYELIIISREEAHAMLRDPTLLERRLEGKLPITKNWCWVKTQPTCR